MKKQDSKNGLVRRLRNIQKEAILFATDSKPVKYGSAVELPAQVLMIACRGLETVLGGLQESLEFRIRMDKIDPKDPMGAARQMTEIMKQLDKRTKKVLKKMEVP